MSNAVARLLILTSALWLLAPPVVAQPAQPDVSADLRMMADSAAYRQTAEAFVARAMAGDLEATQKMLSAQMVDRSGTDAVRRALEQQILPFFVQGAQLGRSVTVARTSDAGGNSGYAFYMWLAPRGGGEASPFTVYVVEEKGRRVVANVLPGRRVPGRHV